MSKHPANHETRPDTRGNRADEEITIRFDRSNQDVTEIHLAFQRGSATPNAPPPLGSEAASNRRSLHIASEVGRPPSEGRDPAENLLQVVLDEHFSGGKHLMFVGGEFYNYTGKLWQLVSDEWVKGRILEAFQSSTLRIRQNSGAVLRQVTSLLAAKVAPQSDLFAAVEAQHQVINCANGELQLDEDGKVNLRPHVPESLLRHCLDVHYDPKAKCPEYDQALLEIFSDTKEPEAMARHWNEIFGYIIQGRRNIPVIVILFGRGGNGKSKLMETVRCLLGEQLVHAQRVGDLKGHRFTMGSLCGKRLFIDDDVDEDTCLPDGILKTISEAKLMTGEQKYKPLFNFIVRTVPVLPCNNIPALKDVSPGMLRRLMVIPFTRTFDSCDRDDQLFDRILRGELPGVLNRALQGYRRLTNRSKFDMPGAVQAATQSWVQSANSIAKHRRSF